MLKFPVVESLPTVILPVVGSAVIQAGRAFWSFDIT